MGMGWRRLALAAALALASTLVHAASWGSGGPRLLALSAAAAALLALAAWVATMDYRCPLLTSIMLDSFTTGYGLGAGYEEQGLLLSRLIGYAWPSWFLAEYVVLAILARALPRLLARGDERLASTLTTAFALALSAGIGTAALSNASLTSLAQRLLD